MWPSQPIWVSPPRGEGGQAWNHFSFGIKFYPFYPPTKYYHFCPMSNVHAFYSSVYYYKCVHDQSTISVRLKYAGGRGVMKSLTTLLKGGSWNRRCIPFFWPVPPIENDCPLKFTIWWQNQKWWISDASWIYTGPKAAQFS